MTDTNHNDLTASYQQRRHTDYLMGEHAALLRTLTIEMAEVKRALSEIKNDMAEERGRKRMSFWLASTGGAIIGAAFASLPHWIWHGQ